MATRLTRVSYCENCAQTHHPVHSDRFIVIGRSHKQFTIWTCSSPHAFGFTPHIFEREYAKDGNVYFSKICGVCGFKIDQSDAKPTIVILSITHSVMPISEWNAMVQFTDSGYKLDD